MRESVTIQGITYAVEQNSEGFFLNNSEYDNDKVFDDLDIPNKRIFIQNIVEYFPTRGVFPFLKTREDLERVIDALLAYQNYKLPLKNILELSKHGISFTTQEEVLIVKSQREIWNVTLHPYDSVRVDREFLKRWIKLKGAQSVASTFLIRLEIESLEYLKVPCEAWKQFEQEASTEEDMEILDHLEKFVKLGNIEYAIRHGDGEYRHCLMNLSGSNNEIFTVLKICGTTFMKHLVGYSNERMHFKTREDIEKVVDHLRDANYRISIPEFIKLYSAHPELTQEQQETIDAWFVSVLPSEVQEARKILSPALRKLLDPCVRILTKDLKEWNRIKKDSLIGRALLIQAVLDDKVSICVSPEQWREFVAEAGELPKANAWIAKFTFVPTLLVEDLKKWLKLKPDSVIGKDLLLTSVIEDLERFKLSEKQKSAFRDEVKTLEQKEWVDKYIQ